MLAHALVGRGFCDFWLSAGYKSGFKIVCEECCRKYYHCPLHFSDAPEEMDKGKESSSDIEDISNNEENENIENNNIIISQHSDIIDIDDIIVNTHDENMKENCDPKQTLKNELKIVQTPETPGRGLAAFEERLSSCGFNAISIRKSTRSLFHTPSTPTRKTETNDDNQKLNDGIMNVEGSNTRDINTTNSITTFKKHKTTLRKHEVDKDVEAILG